MAEEVKKQPAAGDEQVTRLQCASQRQLIWRRFKKHRLALAGLIILSVFYFIAIFAEVFAPYAKREKLRGYENSPPSSIHFLVEGKTIPWPHVYATTKTLDKETFHYEFVEDTSKAYPVRLFVKCETYRLFGFIPCSRKLFGTGHTKAPVLLFGTDKLGRDIFSRVIYGARISLFIGLAGVFLSFVLGCLFGGLAGYFGGWVDDLIQWLYQTLASVPGLLLLIALTFVLGQGLTNVAIALGVVGWVGLCRLMRAEYLKHKERDYVLAARALGAGNYRIIFKHILPNTFHIVIISFSLGFVRAIMGEVVLTFVGLGAQAHEPSWGRMISDARAELARDPAVWWPLAGATAAMFVVCLAFNILGDSLRDALDPRLKV